MGGIARSFLAKANTNKQREIDLLINSKSLRSANSQMKKQQMMMLFKNLQKLKDFHDLGMMQTNIMTVYVKYHGNLLSKNFWRSMEKQEMEFNSFYLKMPKKFWIPFTSKTHKREKISLLIPFSMGKL